MTPPIINAVDYNALTGQLTLTGANLSTGSGGYKAAALTLSGDGGGKFTLTAGSKVSGTPNSSQVVFQLSAANQLAVDGLLNLDGTQANDGVSIYNLAAKAGWDSGAGAVKTLAVTVSNVVAPSLSAVGYNAGSGVFTFSGANLVNHGGSLGIALNDFSLTAGSGGHFSFSGKDAVSHLTANGFTVTLSSADKALVNALTNDNGSSPLRGPAYNIVSAANWDSDTGAAIGTLNLTVSGAAQVRTLVSSGLSHPTGIAVDSQGDVFISDYSHNVVKELIAGSHTPITIAAIKTPGSMALDQTGDLYVANVGANILEKISAGTHAVNIITGGLSTPSGIAVDSAGDVFISNFSNNTIAVVPVGINTLVSLFMGFNYPTGIALDAAGNLYAANYSNHSIVEYQISSKSFITLASSGFNTPDGLAVDRYGNVFFTSYNGNSIKEIAANSGTVTTLLGSGLNNPVGIAIDSNGNLYITDNHNNAVKELTHSFYDLNTSPATAKPVVIGNLWENTGQIELSKSVFTAFAGETSVSAANFSNAASPGSAADYLYYNAASGGLYYDADGSGNAAAAVEIAIIGAHSHPAALSVGDFQLLA